MTLSELTVMAEQHGCTVTSEHTTIRWTDGSIGPVTYLHVAKDSKELFYLDQNLMEVWYDFRIIKHLFDSKEAAA